MLALWLEDQTLIIRNDVPVPEPPEGEALVRVLLAGICNTDLELTRGYYPFTGVPGHEFVGLVEIGPTGLLGRRVVAEINAVCGECAHCLAGQRNHCTDRTVLGISGRNGVFAEYMTIPYENLHVVPDAVSTETATFTEPLAAALQIQEQIDVTCGARVLVVGDGKLGQLVAQTLDLTGCNLMVVGRNENKLALLADRGINARIVDSAEPDVFDIAVECTGNPEGVAIAQAALKPRGALVMKSTYAGRLDLDAAAVVVNEQTLMGSRCGPFEPALKLLVDGLIDVQPLISARYPLAEAVAAFEYAHRRDVLKVLLDIG